MAKKEKKKDAFDKAIEQAEMLEAKRKEMEEPKKEENLDYIG